MGSGTRGCITSSTGAPGGLMGGSGVGTAGRARGGLGDPARRPKKVIDAATCYLAAGQDNRNAVPHSMSIPASRTVVIPDVIQYLGVSSGNGKGQIFVRGKVVKTVPEHQIVQVLLDEAQQRDWSHPSHKK